MSWSGAVPAVWEHRQTTMSAPSCGFYCPVKPPQPPISSIARLGLRDGGRGHTGAHHPGKALSGGTIWPEMAFLMRQDQHPCLGVASDVGSQFIIYGRKMLSPASSVKRSMLFLTETDTFKPAVSLHAHSPIQIKSSCEHEGNTLSMQPGAPKCASTAVKISWSSLVISKQVPNTNDSRPAILMMFYYLTFHKDPQPTHN